ncbi:MAG: tripartite tricarboxylate transporter substrate binding protein [Pigmentiphaga sp.]|uniref:tripartite tricarboxylate transporter substrate binding protein n=1 Tax=Pigmentiphaga sp. TaxID=1977564 RepID=UPI0029ACA0BE|nr:tripartite tricarboxylate transporter substrate binding protein [Pigmentiphaga sp.]MDX3904997.1 tripartite tricarboxylate transporter substrate binding protein [Pigmentiphaga sp.]
MNKHLLAVALATAAATGPAHAAEWPSRAITMVVPFAPGGVADTVARPVAEAMSRKLGQPVVVENKPGSGGAVGIAHVARATPNGYTILISLPSISSMPTADKLIGRQPMYQLDQLTPIARITADPTVLAVRADSPWKTIKDFIEYGRKEQISYGSSGVYGTLHMYMASLANAAGLKTLHVPYGGAGPALLGLLGNQIQAVAASPASVKQHVDSGAVRVLAHWGDEPIEAFPDLPSLKSLGYDLEFYQWSGLFAPSGTPRDALEKLGDAARFAVEDARVKKTIEGAGLPIKYLDTTDFTKYWQQDASGLIQTVQRIGKVD